MSVLMTGDHSPSPGPEAALPPSTPSHKAWLPLWLQAILFGVLYYACAQAGSLLSLQKDTYVGFWIPTGLYLGVLLLNDRRAWPWLIVGAFAGNATFDVLHGSPLAAIPFFCLGNALQAVGSAWLIQRFVSRHVTLTTLREFTGVMMIGAGLGTAVDAAIGAAALVLTGISSSFLVSFRVWWGSCGMAVLIFLPFIVSWFAHDQAPLLKTRKHLLEAGLLLAFTVFLFSKSGLLADGILAQYKVWIIPPLLWSGLRFGLRGASAMLVGLAILLSVTTGMALNAQPAAERVEDLVSMLQITLAVSALVALIPAVVLRERDKSTADLRRSRERFELAMRGSNDGYWDWNILTNDVYYSGRFRELLGYPASGDHDFPPTFATFHAHLHPDDRDLVQKRVREHLEHLEPYDIEYRMRHRSGEYRWFRVRGHAVWNERDKAVRMAGSLTDITGRKESEVALRESEERYRTLVEFSPECVAISIDRHLAYINPAGVAMLGARDASEIIGRPAYDFVPPPAREELERRRQALVEHGVPTIGYESELLRLDGSRIVCDASVVPLVYQGKAATLALIRDITERKRAEESLRESEKRFRSYFELPIVGLAITSLEKGFIEVNDQFCEMLGYSRSELKQLRWSELTHPDDLQLDTTHFNCVLAGEQDGYTIEKRFLRRDKKVIDSAMSVRCVRRADGSPDYFLAMVQDITQRKQAEAGRAEAIRREQQALEDYTRRLIESQEAERRRIAGELHDSLGQNLLLIHNHVQQALAQPGAGTREEQLSAIGKLTSEAIAEVRNISRDLRPYQLDQLGLTYALQSLIDGVARSSGLAIERKLDPADDAVTAEGATNLYRIVQESLTNILKHSGARHVTIQLERDVRHLFLWIKDDGKGFDGREFPPSSSSKGGLGLRNIFERVRILGGTLKIHSAPGQGTSLEITVPIAEGEPETT